MTAEDTRLSAPHALPAPATTRQFYIPCLDGIRALAVIAVFLSHAGMDGIVPGGLGVTTFFFLSGFLITSLLRSEYERTGGINFRNFYLRRVLRIWPPMYIFIGVAAIVCCVLPYFEVPKVEPLVYQLGHLANYYRLYGGEKFIPGTVVLWSLAVEEHFYILFPVAFLYMTRHLSGRSFGIALATVCAAMLTWRCILVWGWHVPIDRTYKATDTRVDSILFGCMLAVVRNPYMDPVLKWSTLRKVLAMCTGLLLIGLTLVIRNKEFRETLRYTIQGIGLIPIFYMAVAEPQWPVFRWLNWSTVRFIGLVSYSIYLSHYFALYVAWGWCGMDHRIGSGLVATVLVLGFALTMYYLIEQPCARLRRKLHV